MKSFEYAQPESLSEVLLMLEKEPHQVVPMGGGTALLSMLKDGLLEPRRIVSLANVKKLREIRYEGTSLRIGSMATHSDLLESARVRELFPSLIDGCESIGSPQLRNQGTLGGQVMRRPECWYYRRGHGLHGSDMGVSLPEKGDHRNHAVFGNSGPAKFVSSSRLGPILYSLDVTFVTAASYKNAGVGEMAESKTGRGITAYFRSMGNRMYTLPATMQDEELNATPQTVLTHVLLPPRMPTAAYYEVRSRRGFDQPEASCAVSVETEGDTVRRLRVVLGHVAPIPWKVDLNPMLHGKPLNEATAEEASRLAVAGATPMRDNQHKVELARVATKRALLKAFGRFGRGRTGK